jgi:hypothetical protein
LIKSHDVALFQLLDQLMVNIRLLVSQNRTAFQLLQK